MPGASFSMRGTSGVTRKVQTARAMLNIPCRAGDRSLGCLGADCASIQAHGEFNQPFSEEEDDTGQHSEGPHSKAQRLRGASQQSLTGDFIEPLA